MPAFLALALVVLAAPGWAADVAVSTTSQVWFGNALQAVMTAAVPPIAAMIGFVLWKVAAKFGIEASAADVKKFDDEAKKALTQAAVKAGPLIEAEGWDHADVHNQVLADALNFFLQRYPDRSTAIATAAGVSDPAAQSIGKDEAVKDSLRARLPDAMNEAAASPATPALPPVAATPIVINMPAPVAPPPAEPTPAAIAAGG